MVMLHDFFSSSRAIEPLMRALAHVRSVWAPDLAGFGDSDPLPSGGAGIADHARMLAQVLDGLAIRTCDLGGIGAGGLVALEMAVSRPDLVRRLVLWRVPLLLVEEESALRGRHAPPDLRPRADGTHLVAAWSYARDRHLYWPWSDRTATAVLSEEFPSEIELHAETLELLSARVDQGYALDQVLDYVLLESVARLRTPTLVATAPGRRFERFADAAGALAPQLVVSERAADETRLALVVERFLD